MLVGGWFAAFAIVKGSYVGASVEDGSVFRIIMPAFPAFILLLASIPLLLPHAPRALRPWIPAMDRPSKPRRRLAIVLGAIVLSAVVPLAAFAAARTSGGPAQVALLGPTAPPVPVNVDLGLTARTGAHGTVLLHWKHPKSVGGPVFYRVWRGPAASGDGLVCPVTTVARACTIGLPEVGVTHGGSLIDKPGKGHWVYRVAVAANWLDDPTYGDVYLVSSPLRVTIR